MISDLIKCHMKMFIVIIISFIKYNHTHKIYSNKVCSLQLSIGIYHMEYLFTIIFNGIFFICICRIFVHHTSGHALYIIYLCYIFLYL